MMKIEEAAVMAKKLGCEEVQTIKEGEVYGLSCIAGGRSWAIRSCGEIGECDVRELVRAHPVLGRAA